MADSSKTRLLQKLISLRDRAATEGERKAADVAIRNICEKYNLSEIDLSDKGQEIECYWFTWDTKLNKRLLSQIICSKVGYDGKKYKSLVGKRELGAYMTQAQAVEVEFEYSYYKQLLKDDMEILYIAFIHKHDIFPDQSSPEPNREEVDRDYLERLMWMIRGLSDAELRKALPEQGIANDRA